MDDRNTRPQTISTDPAPVSTAPQTAVGTQRASKRPLRGMLLAAGAAAVILIVLLVTVLANRHPTTTRAHIATPTAFPTQTIVQVVQSALLKSGTLTWGSDASVGAPDSFADPAHPETITGLDAAFIGALTQRLHLQSQFISVPWTQFPQQLQGKKIDLFADGVVTTDIPANDAVFTAPYMITSTEIVLRSGDTRFKDLTDLKGHQVGVLKDDRGAAVAQGATDLQIQTYDSTLPFEALAAGRIDAVIVSAPLAQWYGAHDALKRFSVLQWEIQPAPVAIALPVSGAHTQVLQNVINQEINMMAQDGTLAKLLTQWGMTDPLQECVTMPKTTKQDCP